MKSSMFLFEEYTTYLVVFCFVLYVLYVFCNALFVEKRSSRYTPAFGWIVLVGSILLYMTGSPQNKHREMGGVLFALGCLILLISYFLKSGRKLKMKGGG
jgi:drug/metabolite transporter (DMT)-like permease